MDPFYIFPFLIAILCINTVSSYMYFDVTIYDTNITITEILTPFVKNDKIDLLLSTEIKSPKQTCHSDVLKQRVTLINRQQLCTVSEVIIWISNDDLSICQYTAIYNGHHNTRFPSPVDTKCTRVGGVEMMNPNFFK